MSIAPDFSLPDQNGTPHTLSEYRGKWLVLYFYPKDDTPGCTKEACSFRDNFTELTDKGICVVGISKDSVTSHGKFASKYQLPFTILADPEKTTIHAYGAWGEKSFMGRKFEGVLRNTVLINPNGVIQKVYEHVNPLNHTQEILKDFDSLRAQT